MGQVHTLIALHGRDGAIARAEDKLDRQCVETAYAVLSDEQQRIGVMHAGFAMAALPHKDIQDTVWIRQGGSVKLRVESGVDASDVPVGVPFGSIARMILLYLQTEAVKTRSRDIELGRSMNHWLGTMGIDNGGKTYRLVREQSKRLSLCRLTFYRQTDNATLVTNGSFVRDAILPTRASDQLQLWREAVRLDEGFYQSLIDHPMPVRETAIREIGHRSMAIDVYVWLAYRLHQLERPTPVSWAALYAQFGAGYAQLRQFRAKFKEPLSLALAAYPEAQVAADETGVTLYPSPSPVPQRQLIA
ncbi:pirin [Azospirillum sp. RWY-5-1]|uniref:Pirin n=1 Tax=Azospirillum oleiclasticum TaxID=2735135 RepID=A0ABX2TLB1_9PROT|nr:replication protein RepA [Azospirillum oleiclasticum]NYZ17885.1 pirin [Azospirillum oleiclasticum]NYZ25093.1 pirin [Azospirillum oleiclasticum]